MRHRRPRCFTAVASIRRPHPADRAWRAAVAPETAVTPRPAGRRQLNGDDPRLSTRRRRPCRGTWRHGDAGQVDVFDKYSGAVIGRAERASRAQVDAAIASAQRSFANTPLDAQQRFEWMRRTAALVEQHKAELAALICAEGGLPITDATNEVTRTAQTFLVSAEEAKRLVGEMVPIDAAPGQAHRMAYTLRVPRGVVCGITSFNSPLNMVAHKVAPALASGNTVVVKPPELAPLSATRLCELLIEAGGPPAHVQLVHGPGADLGTWLVEHPGIALPRSPAARGRAVAVRPWRAASRGLEREIAATIVGRRRRLRGLRLPACRADVHLDPAPVRRCPCARRLHGALLGGGAPSVGDPHDPATDVGPIANPRAEAWWRRPCRRHAPRGRTRGAVLPDRADAWRARRGLRRSAPVLSIILFTSFDEASMPNAVRPAAGCPPTTSRAHRAARRLHFGWQLQPTSFRCWRSRADGREGPRTDAGNDRVNAWCDQSVGVTESLGDRAMFTVAAGGHSRSLASGHTNYALSTPATGSASQRLVRHEQQAAHAPTPTTV
jgi:succinate-semialdehyde dehydrogenase/glutarate-semialdehyde dehydrogenase